MGECLIVRRGGESYELPVLSASYPKDVTVTAAAGASAGFSISITTPGRPAEYTYQWYRNGAAVSGGTAASLTLTGLTAAATYSVYCKVTNKAGSVNSRTAILTVRSYLPAYTYTGSHQLIDDGNYNWRLKLLTSGTLTFSHLGSAGSRGAQAFLVGGGGGGGTPGGEPSGGGGGGYTATTDVTLPVSAAIKVTVGGSAVGSRGGSSALTCAAASLDISAMGGYPGITSGNGGDGGSGGGGKNNANAAAGRGGSDGSRGFDAVGGGGANPTLGGSGQIATTREFGEAGGALYAGGGGGGFGNSEANRAGGAGGGGTGGGWGAPLPTGGAPNTGGGAGGTGLGNASAAAGGSGIVIIRNRR